MEEIEFYCFINQSVGVFSLVLLQQDGTEACGITFEAVEEQERSAGEADEEGTGPIARLWSSPDRSNSGMSWISQQCPISITNPFKSSFIGFFLCQLLMTYGKLIEYSY